MPLWGKFGIIALVALALTLLPGGRETVNAVLTRALGRLLRADRPARRAPLPPEPETIESLEPRQRFVLYSSIGLALLTFTATNRLFDQGGLGVLAWLALLGLATYGDLLGLDPVPALRDLGVPRRRHAPGPARPARRTPSSEKPSAR